MSRRKELEAAWARIESGLPDRPLTVPELDALMARWSAVVDRIYSRSR